MANQNEKILNSLLLIEENDKCCDCGSKGSLSDRFHVLVFIAFHKKIILSCPSVRSLECPRVLRSSDFPMIRSPVCIWMTQSRRFNCVGLIHIPHDLFTRFSLQLCSFKNKTENFLLFRFAFRRRLCIVQPRDILVRRLLAGPPESRHTSVEGEAFIVGLLGGLTDQATHGHWQPKGEARVREARSSLLSTAEGWRASSTDPARAVHTVEV